MGKLNTVQNGKGSKKRPTNLKKYNENFDSIDWSKKDNQQQKK
jgi:hypothetical protein